MPRFCLIAALACLLVPSAFAGECTANSWQPTFVRHDAAGESIYYVTPRGEFMRVRNAQQAQSMCSAQGVRDPISGQSCIERSWDDFGCTCNISPSPNTTCAAFQTYLRTQGLLR